MGLPAEAASPLTPTRISGFRITTKTTTTKNLTRKKQLFVELWFEPYLKQESSGLLRYRSLPPDGGGDGWERSLESTKRKTAGVDKASG